MKNSPETRKRLREWGLSHYETLTDFAKDLGVAPQNLNNYLDGSRSPGNKMKSRLEKIGCDIYWLEHGQTKEEVNKKIAKTFTNRVGENPAEYGLTQYPLVSQIYAGKGSTKTTYEYESKEMLPGPVGRKYRGSLYFKVKGDSMEPKWEAGDYVLVNPAAKPKDGEYGVVGFNSDEGSIKKIFYRDDRLILKSLNTNYPDDVVERDNVWFLGKVISTLHR